MFVHVVRPTEALVPAPDCGAGGQRIIVQGDDSADSGTTVGAMDG